MSEKSINEYYIEFINLEKTTRVFLTLSFVGTLFMGTSAALLGHTHIAELFFILTAIMAVLYYLHYRGYYRIAGVTLSVLITVATTVFVLDGNGLNDPGILAYGIAMVVSALLFGRRYIFLFAGINSIFVVLEFWIETRGYFFGWVNDNARISSPFDLIIVLTLLAVISYFIAITIGIIEENINNVVESENKITDAYNLTLEGWALALELKDKETEGHSRRVTELSLKLAKRLAYSEIDLINVKRGALLHDIGKMGIPDEILRKNEKLTDQEIVEIRKHPEYAYNMLKSIGYLRSALDIPCFHHEQWDGKGYPEGRAGEEIPEFARIFALVDNWDALSSDRPYRKAWQREKIIRYIQDESGKKFDPRLVPIFLELVTGQKKAYSNGSR